MLNLIAYGAIIIPCTLVVRYLKDSDKVKHGKGLGYSILRMCLIGQPYDELDKDVETGIGIPHPSKPSSEAMSDNTTLWYCIKLSVCVVGLQFTYLTWGLLQERIMTQSYDGDTFTTSQFLVFINRISAFLIAATYISIFPQPRHIPPLYKYSYSSFSNVISSWCQYEALKYVGYPTQILAKACKVIPVMLMGKVVSNKTYHLSEYLTAMLLSMGVAVFLLGTANTSHKYLTETSIVGMVILLCYLWFDSFTSNWQNELFTQYKMTPVQMMFGINIFSSLFTLVSLILQRHFFSSLSFLLSHQEFAFHSIVLSLCSAFGQLFIFYTIAQFGPLVFTLVMTSRQALSILFSCIVYGHVLTHQAMIGVAIVFISILLRVYFRHRNKNQTVK
jgi:adenosine 3'-phospho 5'-phosphosulfate transporter B2